jgi:AbrB family looped-hinge helix DNA binding protein
MKEIVSTITSKGQVTIPVEVRRYLGVGTNDKVAFVIGDEGEVQLKAPRYSTIASLRGAAGSLKKPLAKEEVLEIAHDEAIAAKFKPDA